MKDNKKRELEVLNRVCTQNDISVKLVSELIRAAKKFSYENVSDGTRVTEYQDLIKYLSKDNGVGGK
ncbi:DNA modification system-associated small protein [Peribacillus sp. B-H-3]|uniref:DNA modification system-associated small protein n=1 Tax=Peribacillus sp. B-H-3 TaxID=3400420 RepID=UPI003B016DFE